MVDLSSAKTAQRTRSSRWRRAAAWVAALLFLSLAGVAGGALYLAHSSLPQLDGTIHVAGLSAPVTVVRDAQGVPHIDATTLEDLFFAQGYVAAQDRLWQMDMARRYASGELAEILGESVLPHDREQRILQIRDTAERAAAAMGPVERSHFESYARGVNALIAAQQDRLPIEFRVLRYSPRPWTATDSVLIGANMSKLLNHHLFAMELTREKILARLGPELTADLYPSSSWRDRPPGSSPSAPPEPERELKDGDDGEESPAPPVQTVGPARQPEQEDRAMQPAAGSNNWVLAGVHTVSGKPLLANDMHLPHQIPNIWYEAHLQSDDFDVAGVTLPGFPYVLVGHNRRIAWGFTNLGPDVQDIFIETFNQSGEYQVPEGWKKPEIRRETIRIKGGREVSIDVQVTRHGPIVSELIPGETRRLALAWTLYVPAALATPFFAINAAANWQEFRSAFSRFGGPAQNVVYADVDGHIGYQATGLIPIRKAGDGTVPVPGHDGSHDWVGFVAYEQLPSVLDPPSGILATANGRITPDSYPFLLSRNWASPYRTQRILEVLESERKFTRQDMLALQMDLDSVWDQILAEYVLTAVEEIGSEDARVQQAADLLEQWDGRITSESAAAAILSGTRRELQQKLLRPKLGDLAGEYRWFMSSVALENILTQRLAQWLPLEYPTYDDLLVAALEAAVTDEQAPKTLAQWRFGRQFSLEIAHPIFGRIPILRRVTGSGVVEQSGNGFTVKQVGRSFGPSERMTVDFSDLDASTLNIVTGQSGQVLSPHYMDHWKAWLEGRTYSLPFSATAVARSRRHQLVLQSK